MDLAVVIDAAAVHGVHVGALEELDQLSVVPNVLEHLLKLEIAFYGDMKAHVTSLFLTHYPDQNKHIHHSFQARQEELTPPSLRSHRPEAAAASPERVLRRHHPHHCPHRPGP